MKEKLCVDAESILAPTHLIVLSSAVLISLLQHTREKLLTHAEEKLLSAWKKMKNRNGNCKAAFNRTFHEVGFSFSLHLPSCFDAVEVLAEGAPQDPELGQAELISLLDLRLPHIDGSLGAIVLVPLHICYGMLLHGREREQG